MNDIKTVVQQFCQFLSQRDLKNLVSLFSEHVDWYIPGDMERVKWLGRRSNRQSVQEFYELLWKNTEPVSATIDAIFFEDNKAVISGAFTTLMLQTGKSVDSLFFIQMTVEAGNITHYRLLEDSHAVSVALSPLENPSGER